MRDIQEDFNLNFLPAKASEVKKTRLDLNSKNYDEV
jgi:hypothetical protein